MNRLTSLCIMPVYNQVHELPALLEECRQCMPADHFIIIDNGSDDGSERLIAESGFEFERTPTNSGIGHALKRGAEIALDRDCGVVSNIAGNGKMRPSELSRVLDPVCTGECDYASGSRFLDGGQAPNLPTFRRLAIPLVVNTVVRVLFQHKLTDATCGLRAYGTTLLGDKRVEWRGDWLHHYQFEYYLYAKALKLNYRCIEVPCSMIYPADGRRYSKITPFIGWWEMLQPWLYVGLGIR